jgi:hypothetical protein
MENNVMIFIEQVWYCFIRFISFRQTLNPEKKKDLGSDKRNLLVF